VPRTGLGWFVVAWMWVVPALVLAQERRGLTLEAGEAPVSVFADRIESLERERLLIAEGRVEIEQGELRLEADRVELNTETGEAVAVGRVVFFDGRDRLSGERIEYSFRTGTGIVYRGAGFAEPHFFFGGERLERFGEKAYRLVQGVFTTCEADPPAWSVRWGRATAYLDDWVFGTNASFWVKRLPLVPFVPFFAASLRRGRQTGFLTPSIGDSNTKGFTVRQPFFWAIADNQDLTLVPTYFEKRGLGLGGAYRYVRREGSFGEVDGFFLRDTLRDQDRWVVGLRHQEILTPQLDLKADLAQVSDDRYFAEFGDSLAERSRQRLESTVALTQRWERWNLVGRLFTYEDLTTEAPVELRRLPEIRLNAFQQPLPWVPEVLFDLDSQYVNFVRDLGAAGQRLDLHPRLSYPLSPGGYFTVTPRVGLRETVYDTRVVGTRVERGFTVEETESALRHRTLFEGAVDLEARAFRVFDLGGAFGIQRLQHVIEPRVTYAYLSKDTQASLPQFDDRDRIPSQNTLAYSLINRVKARATGQGEAPGRVWELLRFTLSQSYAAEPPTTPGARRLSELLADLILEPVFGVRLRGTASFDVYEPRVTQATTDAVYEAQNVSLSFGTRHGAAGALQFVQGAVAARLPPRWAVRVATNFDVVTNTVIENRLEVEFREQCWGVTAAFVDRTNEDEFHITVNLLELGQYGFGRVFGAAGTP